MGSKWDMVRCDHNHPSIMAWSFCNKGGCRDHNDTVATGKQFRMVSYQEDAYRPVTANMLIKQVGIDLTPDIDVQGFSHQDDSVFDSFHKKFPDKPTIGSECCSGVTQRGEDFPDNSKCILSNFNANCNKPQTENQLDRGCVAGCMVWTLFDYNGEPHFGWPHVSSSFGSIDLAGFAKASAYWYRSWWLYNGMKNHSTGGIDVPINPPKLVNPDSAPGEDNAKDDYYLVQHWEPNDNANTRTVHVYTNAPMAELFINSKSQGVQQLVWQGWAEWNVICSSGNLTATALSDQHSIMATHTVLTSGTLSKIMAYLDVPNEETGTGSALLLNGQNSDMINATILDSNGWVVHSESHNGTFSIVSGPGRIIGVGNGNPACHEPNQVSWKSAYHGLTWVIVQVTENHPTLPEHRQSLIQIDRDGGIHTHIQDPRIKPANFADDIVVEVSAPGVGSSTVIIPVSTDYDLHDVVKIAKKSLK